MHIPPHTHASDNRYYCTISVVSKTDEGKNLFKPRFKLAMIGQSPLQHLSEVIQSVC
ncbi:hypothetical protein ABMY44_16705 [Pseudoalteromonas sp. Cnat2-41]|uniref:hypothetical protein n=1 Tax=unclassified Pseudoalteromonas TaxID=194690 RepID=UPI001EF86B55|nr:MULTISPECIES: hypothetical protein [unclassified Pseudoalteromonas]MCF2861967.1 hypothetical protein [Pseudoalteromonas sp. CNAT2-18]MCG7559660.1 hypothetical protein [Pseudoalteromonas sp. CNAT2-18.1]